MPGRLVLASASPRRLTLLAQVGVKPDYVCPAEVNEIPAPNELPRHTAARLAREKARVVAEHYPNDIVLAADTVVACGRLLLDKPDSETVAEAHLRRLSGQSHRVYGAVSVVTADGRMLKRLVVTRVIFKRLHDREIATYLASGEWQGKAGAYAIQGLADGFVKKINGSYSNVVGLPLYETLCLLNSAGLE